MKCMDCPRLERAPQQLRQEQKQYHRERTTNTTEQENNTNTANQVSCDRSQGRYEPEQDSHPSNQMPAPEQPDANDYYSSSSHNNNDGDEDAHEAERINGQMRAMETHQLLWTSTATRHGLADVKGAHACGRGRWLASRPACAAGDTMYSRAASRPACEAGDIASSA